MRSIFSRAITIILMLIFVLLTEETQARQTPVQVEEPLCPSGLTACRNYKGRVRGKKEYQCIDITSDTRNCGGCRWGAYGSWQEQQKEAEDCLLWGSWNGDVACSAGRCIATSCNTGSQLIDDRCVLEGFDVDDPTTW